MKEMIKNAAILFAITLVAGCLLGLVNEVTKDPIAAQQLKAKNEACKNVFQDAERFEEALSRLESKMLLFGYRDYPDICSEIAKMIEEGMKARKKSEAICDN